MRTVGGLIMLMVLAGIIGPGPAAAEVVGSSSMEVQSVAEPIIGRLLAGLNANNYAQFSQDFDAGFKEFYSQAVFTQMQSTMLSKLGVSTDRQFLRFVNQPVSGRTVVTYKVHYPQAAAPAPQWLLFSMVLSKRGDSTVVVSLP